MTTNRLTKAQREMLEVFAAWPNGMYWRLTDRDRVRELAGLGLVCDPHTTVDAVFSRITEAGRAALQQENNHAE